MRPKRSLVTPRAITRAVRSAACVAMGFVAISFFPPAAQGQDSSGRSGEPASTVALRQWVQQLGDASYKVRDEAANKLFRQGQAAEEILTEASADPDPEIQSRARLILDRIRQAKPPDSVALPSADPEPPATHRELVQRLGDASFFTRERAAEELESLGVAGKAALVEALNDPDFEIRWRARQILSRVLQDEFEARLAAFVADVGGKQQLVLPGWRRFQDLVGDDRDTRRMFAQMTRAEGELLAAYEQQSPQLPELLSARTAWLQLNCTGGNSATRSVSPASVATVLLLGLDDAAQDESPSMSPLYQLLSQDATKQSITAGAHASILRILLNKWVTSASGTGSTYGMMLALKYDLKETGLAQATKTIDEGTTSSSALHYAVIAVGRFGGDEHIPLVRPLLDNKTVCHRWSNQALKKDGTINVEVRDAALVVLLRLQGKDPSQYGFNLLRENAETLYYVYTFGFINDEQREAAHAKWAAESGAGGSR